MAPNIEDTFAATPLEFKVAMIRTFKANSKSRALQTNIISVKDLIDRTQKRVPGTSEYSIMQQLLNMQRIKVRRNGDTKGKYFTVIPGDRYKTYRSKSSPILSARDSLSVDPEQRKSLLRLLREWERVNFPIHQVRGTPKTLPLTQTPFQPVMSKQRAR